MLKKLHKWHSRHLDKEMPIVRYGDFGMPMLFFPTAAADYLEYERFRLIDAISQYIDSGLITVFSIDSVNKDAWLNKEIEPKERAWRQVLYDRYIIEEVVPYIREECRTPDIPIVTTGASFGAYHCLNELLKHPEVFSGTIAMSGCFDIRKSADGYHDLNVYYNNPVEYVRNLTDENILRKLRDTRITIVTGQGNFENADFSMEMGSFLKEKDIPVNLDLWGKDIPHDWPSWEKMLLHYIPVYFG